MKLRDDWRYIVRHAWSVRFIALAFVLSGAEIVFSVFQELVTDHLWMFSLASALTTGAAFIVRLVAQKEFDHLK